MKRRTSESVTAPGSPSAKMLFALAICTLLAECAIAHAQSAWTPKHNIEFIATASPGSGYDTEARTIQSVIQQRALLHVSTVVVNKPGGGGEVGLAFLNQHIGDGHYLATMSSNLLTNYILGRSPISFQDLTPIANLYTDYVTLAVKADSPIKSGADLITRLKADPDAVSFGEASALGNTNHLLFAIILKRMGLDARKRVVVFNGSGDVTAALLGGHITLLAAPASNMRSFVEAKSVRILGVASPTRLGGVYADVPTWREQGIDVVIGDTKGLIGPKGLSTEQIAFWDDFFEHFVKTPEWQEALRRNGWSGVYANSSQTSTILDSNTKEYRQLLTDVGLVK